MPNRRILFEKGQPFHILSRAVDGKGIFNKEEDCYRFIFQIQAANLGSPTRIASRKQIARAGQMLLNGEEISEGLILKDHPPLVHFLDFSLVVNHYHFCLVPNTEGGVPDFMKRLNGGFAKHFNLKYKRKGSLFGSRYQAVLIKDDFQLNAVRRYVGIINPLDVFRPGWREKGLKDWPKALKFLKGYQFSSFPDRIGERDCKILAPKEVLEEYGLAVGKDKEDYLELVEGFLKERSSMPGYFLE